MFEQEEVRYSPAMRGSYRKNSCAKCYTIQPWRDLLLANLE
jgi:hypothetical protein